MSFPCVIDLTIDPHGRPTSKQTGVDKIAIAGENFYYFKETQFPEIVGTVLNA